MEDEEKLIEEFACRVSLAKIEGRTRPQGGVAKKNKFKRARVNGHEMEEQAAGEQAAGEQAAGEQAAEEQAVGEQAAGEQAAGEQAAGKQEPNNHPFEAVYEDTKVWISQLMTIVNDREMLLRLLELDEPTFQKWESDYVFERTREVTRRIRLAIFKIAKSYTIRPSDGPQICTKQDLEHFLKVHGPLAGGFRKGDRVRALFGLLQFKNGDEYIQVNGGDEGIVVGPCSFPNAQDASEYVCVNMGLPVGKVNFHCLNHIEHVPLAGGFQKGDRVRALIAHAPMNVIAGDEGTVVGPCSATGDAEASRRVCVDMGPAKGEVNFCVYTHIEQLPLIGGFKKGDRVRTRIPNPSSNIKVGDEGTVVGPGIVFESQCENASEYLCVRFEGEKGMMNFHYRYGIEHMPLAGGFQKGDRVLSLIEMPLFNIKVGDEGTVYGPSDDLTDSDAEQRLCVKMHYSKNKINFHAITQIEHAPLAGGFRKGERVRSLITHSKTKLSVGDEGIVIGPCNNTEPAQDSYRLCVEFGLGKGVVFFLEPNQIASVTAEAKCNKGLQKRLDVTLVKKDNEPCSVNTLSLVEKFKTAMDKKFAGETDKIELFSNFEEVKTMIEQLQRENSELYCGDEEVKVLVNDLMRLREKANKLREEADRNTEALLDEMARERDMLCKQAERNAQALLEEIAREEKSLAAKKERRRALNKLRAQRMRKREAEEREAKAEEREAGAEEREVRMCASEPQISAIDTGILLINQRLGLDQAAAGQTEKQQKSQAGEEKVSGGGKKDESECCVCLTNDKSWIFIPCGHVCVCRGCAHDIMASSRECPLCRQQTTAIFQVFL